MRKKPVLLILMLLVLMLNACTRSASPAPTATPKTNFPKPIATNGMNSIEIYGTQTAVAAAGLPMPTSAATQGTNGQVLLPTLTPLTSSTQAANIPLPSPTLEGLPTVSANPTSANEVVIPTAGPIVTPLTYTLHSGEFPYCLARRYNVNIDDLLTLNGFTSQTNFVPGMTINIPQSGGAFVGERSLLAHPAQYTVLSDETVYSIACKFGDVDPMSIVQANGLTGDYSLTAGATIQVP